MLGAAVLCGLSACGPHSSSVKAGVDATSDAYALVPADGPCVTPAGVTTLLADYAYAIAIDGDKVYLATMAGVLRVPAAGGQSIALTANAEAYALAIDATNAYYVSDHASGPPNAEGKVSTTTALYAAPLAGGTPQILLDGEFAMHMATDGTWLWWAGGDLYGMALGRPAAPVAFPLEAGASVEALAVGRDSLFLAVYSIGTQGLGAGSIRRANKDGSGVATIVSGLGHPTAITVDDNAVYFNDADSPSGGIARAGLDGTGKTTIAQVLAGSLAVDAHSVYFASADAILKVPKTGGTVETVQNGLKSPGTLAVAPGNVYWVDGTSVARSDPNPGYAVMTACK